MYTGCISSGPNDELAKEIDKKALQASSGSLTEKEKKEEQYDYDVSRHKKNYSTSDFFQTTTHSYNCIDIFSKAVLIDAVINIITNQKCTILYRHVLNSKIICDNQDGFDLPVLPRNRLIYWKIGNKSGETQTNHQGEFRLVFDSDLDSNLFSLKLMVATDKEFKNRIPLQSPVFIRKDLCIEK